MPGIVLTQFRWNRGRPSGQPPEDVAVNTLHWRFAPTTLVEADTIAVENAFKTFVSAWAAQLSNEVALAQFRHYLVPPASGPLGDPAFVHNLTGFVGSAAAATELPPQVSATVTMQTAQRRRWGRIYLPGLCTNANDTGRISSTFVDTVGAAFKTFASSILGSGYTLTIFDRTAWAGNDVMAISMDNVWDVQRRRRFDLQTHRYQSAAI